MLTAKEIEVLNALPMGTWVRFPGGIDYFSVSTATNLAKKGKIERLNVLMPEVITEEEVKAGYCKAELEIMGEDNGNYPFYIKKIDEAGDQIMRARAEVKRIESMLNKLKRQIGEETENK